MKWLVSQGRGVKKLLITVSIGGFWKTEHGDGDGGEDGDGFVEGRMWYGVSVSTTTVGINEDGFGWLICFVRI